MVAYSEKYLVVGHSPGESFVLVNYFFDAVHTNNKMFVRTGRFSLVDGCISFLAQ